MQLFYYSSFHKNSPTATLDSSGVDTKHPIDFKIYVHYHEYNLCHRGNFCHDSTNSFELI